MSIHKDNPVIALNVRINARAALARRGLCIGDEVKLDHKELKIRWWMSFGFEIPLTESYMYI